MSELDDEMIRGLAEKYRSKTVRRPKRLPVGDHRMPANVKDLTGRRFGRLRVTGYWGPYRVANSHSCALWECECDCGTHVCVPRTSLIKGNTRSCGCLSRELTRQRNHARRSHGGERHAEG